MTQWLQKIIQPSYEIIFDEKVHQSILDVINDTKKSLILVSLYNKYNMHLRDAIKRAAGREVQITAVCREDQRKDERAHWEWLADISAEVHVVERLHAKIYCNESTVITTSMNLHESSANNSKEIGFIIRFEEQRRQISEYVTTRLIPHSKPFNSSHKQAPHQQAQRPTSAPAPRKALLVRVRVSAARRRSHSIPMHRCASRAAASGKSTATALTQRNTATTAAKSAKPHSQSRFVRPAIKRRAVPLRRTTNG